jgi:hypothetical protein
MSRKPAKRVRLFADAMEMEAGRTLRLDQPAVRSLDGGLDPGGDAVLASG